MEGSAIQSTRVSARASKGKHPTKEAAMREAMEAEAREQAAMDARMVATSMFVKQEPRSYSRSYSSFPTPTVLPQSHKIARGRGRKKQLDAMSTEQKQAEKEMRMDKMRLAARECRARKKSSIQGLEIKLDHFTEQDRQNRQLIARLQKEVLRLKTKLRSAESKNQQHQQHQHQHQQHQPMKQPKQEYYQMRIDTSLGSHRHNPMSTHGGGGGGGHVVPQVPQSSHVVPTGAADNTTYDEIDFPFNFGGDSMCLG